MTTADTAPPAAEDRSSLHQPDPQPPLSDRMAQSAHHTIDRLAESAGPHIDRLEGGLSDVTVQLKHQTRQARDLGDEIVVDLRAGIRHNPLAAVAAALAVGALLGRLTR